MSAIAQRRTATAAAIIMLLAVLQFVLFAANPEPANAEGPVSVSVTGDCTPTDDGEATGFLSVVVDPDFGAQVSVAGGVYSSSTAGIPVEAPGVYQWTAATNDGFVLESPGSGTVEIEDCKDDEPATVVVSGICVVDEDGFDSGRISVTIEPAGSSEVTIAGATYTESTSGIVVPAGATYPWTAVEGPGWEITGPEFGTLVIEDCSEGTPPVQPPVQPPPSNGVKSALGDLVWFDENQNGRQDDVSIDSDEFPINGATVTLLAPDGTVLAQQVTGVDGLYLFDELDAGNYRVEVCVEGADYTLTNAPGVAKELDSDVFPLGGKDGCARTGIISLPAGVTDLTWDAGIVLEVGGIQIEPTTTTIPSVTVDTLPFTGAENEHLVLISVVALAAGSLLLIVGRRRDEDVLSETTIDGWANN